MDLDAALPINENIFSADCFISFDGAKLHLKSWQSDPKKGAQNQNPIIIGLHGMNDYAECFYLLGPYLTKHNIDFIAYDARGFGRNKGRGDWFGAQNMVQDALTLLAQIKAQFPNRKVFLLGDSMGAATLLAIFGLYGPPKCDGIILCAPAVWGWSNLPIFYRFGLWAGTNLLKDKPLNPPDIIVRKITASDNNEMLLKNGRDANMIWETKPKTLKGLVDLMEIGFKAIAKIDTKTAPKILALFGDKDQIVPVNASLKAKRKLQGKAKIHDYTDGYHMLLRDLGREKVFKDILDFITAD